MQFSIFKPKIVLSFTLGFILDFQLCFLSLYKTYFKIMDQKLVGWVGVKHL
jgi:hypothetical protein